MRESPITQLPPARHGSVALGAAEPQNPVLNQVVKVLGAFGEAEGTTGRVVPFRHGPSGLTDAYEIWQRR